MKASGVTCCSTFNEVVQFIKHEKWNKWPGTRFINATHDSLFALFDLAQNYPESKESKQGSYLINHVIWWRPKLPSCTSEDILIEFWINYFPAKHIRLLRESDKPNCFSLAWFYDNFFHPGMRGLFSRAIQRGFNFMHEH